MKTNAYIGKHKNSGKWILCLQEGTGTGYYEISTLSVLTDDTSVKPISNDFEVNEEE